MIEIPLVVLPGHKTLSVLSQEDREALRAYHVNQVLRAKLTGHKRPRSVRQNNWLHSMFGIVARNTEDPNWDTKEKVKFQVKLEMRFIENFAVVGGNQIMYQMKSFAFDKMPQNEADIKYEEAKLICAKFLKVDPETLEAQAQQEPF